MAPNPDPARIDSRHAFADALRQFWLALPEQTARELWLVDAQFAGWPLDEPDVLAALARWLRQGGRQIHLLAQDFSAVEREHPRFTVWRRPFAHAIAAWQPAQDQRLALDALLLTSTGAIELLDREHWRARHVTEPAAIRNLAENVAALRHLCEPAWPVTTLGL